MENKEKQKLNLKDLSLAQIESFVTGLGAEKYRARQVAEWIFGKGAVSFQEMTNLAVDFRDKLASGARVSSLSIAAKVQSQRGDTVKYLFALEDGQAVESVLMKHDYGNSACVSTQVGCRYACRLCASGLGGFKRNLSAGEIYDQVLAMQQDSGARVSHVVLMGSGEPLENYDAVMTFIRNVSAPYGLNIGGRHITISTCGLVPGIRRLAAESLQLTLAVSLHAPNDKDRDLLMPVNKKYPLKELIPACRDYARATGRRVTFEYALVAGVNDSARHAQELARLLAGVLCHVNLIPVNPVPERGLEPPARRQVELFKSIAEQGGLTVTVRKEFGADIGAACGQLRRRVLGNEK
ncbi:23S rRNA (adenine(2503)-C(2))-methyltransferase RlmN [Pelotomaculum propionicicum]|uniref:Probable dual-specificity RNA methyltransferase RlmN n=1 Tax=Pelotomaculum propionicicum TaxID=258475 RepID=A0A4Y7RP04_9FIRM|nr:23S rRNA (adenine(2503)-C(2))-methyltransferase RlmN [Pelotomaculum propionicicum]NLI11257.1 23S rRNA (adenine(2503)-C(2))-methyltransferase RlmN [Peptococcaceae bacterium]TEB10571.1 putative dual-specificity RNA methyltransferase RlmN [Pelotomaculum propionicicum]